MNLPTVPETCERFHMTPAEVQAWEDLRRAMMSLAAAIDRFQKMHALKSDKNPRKSETL